MGGSNDPSNLIELTPEDHAQAHRKLWEQYGRWQDYCAWQGLAKLSKDKEHHSLVMSMRNKASWADTEIRTKRINGIKKAFKNNPKRHKGENNPCARTYIITTPTGKTIKVKSLKTWAESNGFVYNSFWSSTIGHKKSFKGYTARLT